MSSLPQVALGELIKTAPVRRAGDNDFPVLSMTMHDGLVDQSSKFKKRVASNDTGDYRVASRGQLVVGFPIDEAVLAFQSLYPEAIVSPAYGIWNIIPSAQVDRQYLERYLRSPRAISYYKAKLRGSTARRRSLPKPVFLEMPIPLPSLEEQRRIAGILDAADALRAKRRQALAKLDTLTQSIFIDMFGDPLVTEDDARPWARVDDVARFIRGVTFKPADVLADQAPGSVAVMRTSNVQTELATDDVWFLPRSFVKRDEQFLEPSDTLISSANSWNLVGKCCLIPSTWSGATFGGFVTVLRSRGPGVHPVVLHAWFSTDRIQQTVRGFGRKTTNISNLDLGRCRALRIPRFGEREQARFVDAVRNAADTRNRLCSSLDKIDVLFASLQQRAFRGEL